MYFDLDEARWKPDAKAPLAEMLAYAAEGGGGEMIITGHTDRSGAEDYNRELSRQRAGAVADVVATCGLIYDPLSVTNDGEDMPVIDTADGVPEPKNRRVEITIRPT